MRLAPEKPAVAEWSTPYEIDPFTVSVEQNIDLLLQIDAELRAVSGITLAETNLNFNREEQWFALLGRRGYSSDQAFDRRGLCGLCFRGKRNTEAVVSEFVWRAVAEQRI